MTLIYQLAEGPEVLCAQVLQRCAKQALEKLVEKSTPQDDPSKWARGSMGPAARSHCPHHFLQLLTPQPTLAFLSLTLDQSSPLFPASSLASLVCVVNEQEKDG